MTVTAHCLVKNEGRFIWYSVMSVINHVDKILLWDTGSTDGTLEIIKKITKTHKDKVIFRAVGSINVDEFAKVRQEMLEATDADWFIVVDGDEIWWEESIKKVVEVVKSSTHSGHSAELSRSPSSGQASREGEEAESIVVPTINLIGDIYHYQEPDAGQYRLKGKKGHFALRAVNRKIRGLHSERPHGAWGWVDGNNKMIQDRDPKKILFVDAPYLHASFLQRSLKIEKEADVPKRKPKLKYELGIPFPQDFYYPEVFFRPRPAIVPSVWVKRSRPYIIRAAAQTPLKKVKRRLNLGVRVGY